LNQRIAAAEAVQLIGGFSSPEWLAGLAPQFERYREPSGEFWGAYGPRVDIQSDHMLRKLREDRWTRQAVAAIWKSPLDNELDKKDYPCTVAIGVSTNPSFTHDALDMNVTMRSNDAWLGLPYDMFQFTQYQWSLSRVALTEPGTYTHTAWSMHLYEQDLDASYSVMEPVEPATTFYPEGIGEVGSSWEDVRYRARTIALNPGKVDWDYTDSERWYLESLHG
jgi:thymidylate synthase